MRFIPAWAGNTSALVWGHSQKAVHPRVGGEYQQTARQSFDRLGSSPRGRGIRGGGRPRWRAGRFIPAWAGNTVTPPGGVVLDPVHPRVGGEYRDQIKLDALNLGSSPRGRGIRAQHLRAERGDRFIPAWAGNTAYDYAVPMRFIPAWAGNTARRGRWLPAMPVHPRVGGEYDSAEIRRCHCHGSSPRGRGIHWRSV